MQPQRAIESALDIPELLESILVNLDMKTLLVSASRVSKTWKTLMDNSPAIQQALFFTHKGPSIHPVENNSRPPSSQAQKDEAVHDEGNDAAGTPGNSHSAASAAIINPLLAAKFDKCFFDFGPTRSIHRRANSFYELPWCRHPIRTVQQSWGGWSQLRPPPQDAETARSEAEGRRRFTRRGASWRRMLVSIPPPPALGFMHFDISNTSGIDQAVRSALIPPSPPPQQHAGKEDHEEKETTYKGLRMGQLYDVVQRHAGSHGGHSLWFRVLWGKPRREFALELVRERFEALMARTSVVVEFMQAGDLWLENHPKDPEDAEAFDAVFRCDEYREVAFEAEEGLVRPPEMFPKFESRFLIWHWRLLDHERASDRA